MKDIVALIPVKGASERIQSKNLRPFYDTNLYELKLKHLKNVKGLAKVVISSENEKILEIAKSHGFGVHVRNPKYSTSTVPMSAVYSYIASEIPGEHIAWINVTNPLAGSDVYEKAVEIYNQMDSKHDGLLSVYEVRDYLFKGRKAINFRPNPWPRSQDLSGVYAMSFVVNILKRKDMVKWGSCVGRNPYFYLLDPVVSKDIDFQEDFDFCEMMYKKACLENNQSNLKLLRRT